MGTQKKRSFEHPKHMLKLMGKKIFTLLRSKNFAYLNPMITGILKYFSELIEMNPEMSAAVAAIKTLLHYLENNRCKYRSYARLISKHSQLLLTLVLMGQVTVNSC